MPTVRAKVKCYVNGTYHEQGHVFEYSGPANRCLEAYTPPKPEPAAEPETPAPARSWNPLKWFGLGRRA